MEFKDDNKLKSMGQSLRQHIDLARELHLDFAVKLLNMAAIEIEMNRHDISQRELDALCVAVENDLELIVRRSR